MTTLVDHFHDGGWGMFPTLGFGLLLLAIAVRYALRPDQRLVPLLVSMGILTLSSGALGFVSGMIVTCRAIEQVEKVGTIALLGIGESLNNVAFALIFTVVAAMATSYGAWKLSRGKRDALAA
jgi:hypothetical protein